jgi:hypothetical protein
MPRRSATDLILNGQAKNYNVHRDLYPERHREFLDHFGVVGFLSDPENAAKAVDGFLAALDR